MTVQLDQWRTGLAGSDVSAVRELFASVRAHDGLGPTAEYEFSDDARYLVARDGGRPVGLAWAAGDDPAELLVHPEYRRRGVGTALVSAVLAGGSGVWAHGKPPAAAALAGKLGLTPMREMFQLRRTLPPDASAVRLPEGVQIRTFVPGQDEEQFLGVNARAFSWHPEQGRLDLTGLRAQLAEDWFDPAGFFLAVDTAGTVLGFHWTKVHRADPTPHGGPAGPIGEVYVLGVDPRSPVRGLGRPLTVAGLDYLYGRGLPTVMLYVESDNEPALRLYRTLGFHPWQSDIVYGR